MKARTSALLFLLPLTSVFVFADVKLGDPISNVRATLGLPRGQMQVGDREVFYYDRGEVETRAGAVIRVALRSSEEQAVQDARRAADAARVRDEQEIRRARLTAEGEVLKIRKQADPAFVATPLSYQVAFWEDFSRRYSDVPIAEPLNEARVRLAAQVTEATAKAEQTKRLAELEARVAAAEAEARLVRANSQVVVARNYYRSRRDYDYSSAPMKIETRMYEFPLPSTTSPGMPPMQPVYRKEPSPLYGDPAQNANGSRDDFTNRYPERQPYRDGRSSYSPRY